MANCQVHVPDLKASETHRVCMCAYPESQREGETVEKGFRHDLPHRGVFSSLWGLYMPSVGEKKGEKEIKMLVQTLKNRKRLKYFNDSYHSYSFDLNDRAV